MTTDAMLKVEEVAARLSMTQDQVRRLLRLGRIPGYRLGSRRTGWRVDAAELQAWLAARKGGPAVETMEGQEGDSSHEHVSR